MLPCGRPSLHDELLSDEADPFFYALMMKVQDKMIRLPFVDIFTILLFTISHPYLVEVESFSIFIQIVVTTYENHNVQEHLRGDGPNTQLVVSEPSKQGLAIC